jgi:predicted acyl esterase
LLGKSYDGWTGLMGISQQPQGLAAVVSLEPVYEGYRYMYMNGIRRPPYLATMALFQAIDAKPGRPGDTPQYHANGAPQAWCYGVNLAGNYADDDPHGPYWEERNLIDDTLGKTTPLFLTQGFLETNTHADGAFQYYNGLAGTENRAWFGQFDHARCWEKNNSTSTPSGNNTRWQTGRHGMECMNQIMTFLDEHLKGIVPPQDETPVEVQDFTGRWREEAAFPPADSRLFETQLNTGTYADNGSGNGLRPTETAGLWTVSEPLPHKVWLSGEPIITAGVEAVPNANFSANVYDIDPAGKMTMISRGVSLIRGTGRRTVSFSMYGQDWPLPAGHRIGVLVSDADTSVFTHVPTQANVTVLSAKIGLPFLRFERTEFIPSEQTTPRLENYRAGGTATLSASKLAASEKAFNLPGPLAPNPAEA